MAIRRLLVGGRHGIAQIAWLCATSERSVHTNQRTLIDLGVLSERGRPTAIKPSQYGLVGLLIADNTSPEDIARQLGVPLAEVERQSDLMRHQRKRGRL